MTSRDLPRPITTDHKILMALVTRLDDQNELLTRILDRLPDPVRVEMEKRTVELREPARATTDREPEAKPEQASKPAPARRGRKSTPKGQAPSKETP